VASLERFVLSGLPFWEDGDEALFNEQSQFETPNDRSEVTSPAIGSKKSSVIASIGYKNTLSNIIVERIALEKRQKLTLN